MPLYRMQVWNSLDLRKQNTRLRVTAILILHLEAAGRSSLIFPGRLISRKVSRSSRTER